MKKFFAGLLVLVLALMVMPAALAQENEPAALTLEPVYSERAEEHPVGVTLFHNAVWDSTHTCYRDQLNEAEKAVYDRMVEVFTAFAADMEAYVDEDDCPLSTTEVTFSNGVSTCWVIDSVIEETWQFEGLDANPSFNEHFLTAHAIFQKAGAAVSLDHPEFFWIRQSCSVTMGEYTQPTHMGGTGTEEDPYVFEMTASFDAAFLAYPKSDAVDECAALQTQLNAVVDTIMGELEELPDTEKKLEYVDNWLAANNLYNEPAAKDPTWISGDETPWSIVGGLLDGYSPVCEGYAKAFQLFCHKLGVPCLQVSGNAYEVKNDGTLGDGGAHMWVAVKLDEFWYVCDPTWNDPLYGEGVDKDFSSREYLLVNQPMGHFVDMQFVTPNCGAFTVIFDANGHGTAPEMQTIPYGETATAPEALTAEGYTFGGWYTDKACTEQWNFGTELKKDVTLYAKWTINTYTVTFDVNGHGTAPEAQDVEWKGMASEPEAPTAKNCDFIGWYTAEDEEWDFESAVVTADVTLYAKWIEYAFDLETVEQIAEELANAQEGDEVDADTWECTKDGISGLEVGTGTMMMALYKEKKMLGIVECQVIYENWRDTGWNVYAVSEVDAQLLEQADEIVRFNTDIFYKPVSGTRTVK